MCQQQGVLVFQGLNSIQVKEKQYGPAVGVKISQLINVRPHLA